MSKLPLNLPLTSYAIAYSAPILFLFLQDLGVEFEYNEIERRYEAVIKEGSETIRLFGSPEN